MQWVLSLHVSSGSRDQRSALVLPKPNTFGVLGRDFLIHDQWRWRQVDVSGLGVPATTKRVMQTASIESITTPKPVNLWLRACFWLLDFLPTSYARKGRDSRAAQRWQRRRPKQNRQRPRQLARPEEVKARQAEASGGLGEKVRGFALGFGNRRPRVELLPPLPDEEHSSVLGGCETAATIDPGPRSKSSRGRSCHLSLSGIPRLMHGSVSGWVSFIRASQESRAAQMTASYLQVFPTAANCFRPGPAFASFCWAKRRERAPPAQ